MTATAAPQPTPVRFQRVTATAGWRVVLYGTGGVGKTTLALAAPGKKVFIDLDDSLRSLGKANPRVSTTGILPCNTYQDVYTALNSPGWDGIDSIIIDSLTVLEALAMDDVIAKVRTTKGAPAKTIADYGYGDGYAHTYERMDKILLALENHKRAGRNIVLICHNKIKTIQNAQGEDYITNAPNVISTPKYDFADRLKGWADHLLFVHYKIDAVNKKGLGEGERAILTRETPLGLAKSRTITDPLLEYKPGSEAEIWESITGDTQTGDAPDNTKEAHE